MGAFFRALAATVAGLIFVAVVTAAPKVSVRALRPVQVSRDGYQDQVSSDVLRPGDYVNLQLYNLSERVRHLEAVATPPPLRSQPRPYHKQPPPDIFTSLFGGKPDVNSGDKDGPFKGFNPADFFKNGPVNVHNVLNKFKDFLPRGGLFPGNNDQAPHGSEHANKPRFDSSILAKCNLSQFAHSHGDFPGFGAGKNWLEQFKGNATEGVNQIVNFFKSHKDNHESFLTEGDKWASSNLTALFNQSKWGENMQKFQSGDFQFPMFNSTVATAWFNCLKTLYPSKTYKYQQQCVNEKTESVKAIVLDNSDFVIVTSKDADSTEFKFPEAVVMYDLTSIISPITIITPTDPRLPCVVTKTELTISGVREQLAALNNTDDSDVPTVTLNPRDDSDVKDDVTNLRKSNPAINKVCFFRDVILANPAPEVIAFTNGNVGEYSEGSEDVLVENPITATKEIVATGIDARYSISVKAPSTVLFDFSAMARAFSHGRPPVADAPEEQE